MKKPKTKVDLTKIIIAIAVIFGLTMVVKGLMKQPTIASNNEKAKKIEAEIEEENKKIEELDNTIQKSGTDEYIEKIAREKLGMIKENEIVFIDISGQ